MSVKSTITEVSAHQPQMTHNSPPVEGQLIEDEYTEVGKVKNYKITGLPHNLLCSAPALKDEF